MPPVSVQGQGPKAKARGPKGPTAGVGFLCRGNQPRSISWGSGKRCKLPSGAAKRFSRILEAPHSLSWNLLRSSSGGGGMAPVPPP